MQKCVHTHANFYRSREATFSFLHVACYCILRWVLTNKKNAQQQQGSFLKHRELRSSTFDGMYLQYIIIETDKTYIDLFI